MTAIKSKPVRRRARVARFRDEFPTASTLRVEITPNLRLETVNPVGSDPSYIVIQCLGGDDVWRSACLDVKTARLFAAAVERAAYLTKPEAGK